MSVSTLLDISISHALIASRITGARNSYTADNPIESKKVLTYLKGGARPASATVVTAMGKHLVALEDARRADDTSHSGGAYGSGRYGE